MDIDFPKGGGVLGHKMGGWCSKFDGPLSEKSHFIANFNKNQFQCHLRQII